MSTDFSACSTGKRISEVRRQTFTNFSTLR